MVELARLEPWQPIIKCQVIVRIALERNSLCNGRWKSGERKEEEGGREGGGGGEKERERRRRIRKGINRRRFFLRDTTLSFYNKEALTAQLRCDV